jgi:hypothetical protein
LRGITRIEEIFALGLAVAAMALYVAVALSERRQELATISALGASVRSISAFLWSETVLVLAASLAVAALLGWLLAELLVAMLQHVFDPPPDHLAVPWGFLAGSAGRRRPAPSWPGSQRSSRSAACRSARSRARNERLCWRVTRRRRPAAGRRDKPAASGTAMYSADSQIARVTGGSSCS